MLVPSSSTVDPGGGSSWPIVDGCGGSSLRFVGCEKRETVTCDTAFVTPPNWDVSNCVARPLILDTVSRISLIPFRGVCRRTYILVSNDPGIHGISRPSWGEPFFAEILQWRGHWGGDGQAYRIRDDNGCKPIVRCQGRIRLFA